MKRVLFAVLMLGCLSAAQEAKEKSAPLTPHGYKLHYMVTEYDGKEAVNHREYSAYADDGNSSSSTVKIGSRVPITIGDKGTQYMDVGLELHARLRAAENGHLELFLDFRDEAVVTRAAPGGLPPILRNTNANINTVIAVGKPTVVISADDVNSTHRFEVEVTVTKAE